MSGVSREPDGARGRARATVEHELDERGQRTGRSRRTQFMRTMRWKAVPPSEREAVTFEGIGERGG